MNAKELGEMRAYPANHPAHWAGMSKRELFAAMAMQAILSGPLASSLDSTAKLSISIDVHDTLSSAAIGFADALLDKLSKEQS